MAKSTSRIFVLVALFSTLAATNVFAGKGNCNQETLKRADAGLTSMGTECSCVKVKGTGKEAMPPFACKLAGKTATVYVGRDGSGVKDLKAVEPGKAFLGEAMCKAKCGG